MCVCIYVGVDISDLGFIQWIYIRTNTLDYGGVYFRIVLYSSEPGFFYQDSCIFSILKSSASL